MKISLFLILVSAISLQASSVFSQNKRMTVDMQNVTVREVISEIEKEGGISFLFNDNLQQLNRHVSVSHVDHPIQDVLYSALDQADMMYEEVGENFLVLLPKPEYLKQQDITVTGQVTDANTGEPLPGASIVIQGTTIGTVSNIEGEYSLEVPGPEAVLVYSYVGYLSREILVGSQTEINISLAVDITILDELVVIGYGTMRKALVTGATTNVRSEDLMKLSTVSAIQALQGQTPGMQVLSMSGQPGEGFKLIIRGLGTIGNTTPLFIADGVQVPHINDINVSDIQSIDILKDAASAAIYGSQASNGVVLVTTKMGVEGTTNITFDSYIGFNSVAKHVMTLNKPQYMMIMNEAAVNEGKLPYFTEADINSADEGIDWIKQMYYDGLPISQNHTLGISGGSLNSSYFMSLAYAGDEGIIGGRDFSNYNRYSLRLNSDHRLQDYISVGQRLSFTHKEQRGLSRNQLRDPFQTTPLLPMYDDDGNWFNNMAGTMYNGKPWEVWYADDYNPYARMVLEDQTVTNNQDLFASIYAELSPFDGFKFKSSFGLNYVAQESRGFLPVMELSWQRFNERTQATQSLGKGYDWIFDNIATYELNFDNHAFSLMAGMSAQRTDIGASVNAANIDLTLPEYKYAYVDNANNTDISHISFGGTPYNESRLLSYFTRIGYNFMEKYLVNATFRMDGSSRFSKEHRWGYFPSLSVGWVISQEPFMENAPGWLDFLKPRVSWGQVGNQRVAPYQYLSPIVVGGTGNNAYFGPEFYSFSDISIGANASRLPNPSLKWETSEQTNIGFDAYVLATRLFVNIDWYKKTTKDWIVSPPVLATVGTGAPAINGGNVENRGIELSLSWRDRISNDFTYNISGNFSTNKNEVLSVAGPDGIIHGQAGGLYHNAPTFYRLAEPGFPISYFWGWKTDGIFQNESEVLNHVNSEGKVIQPNAKPGDLRYVDQDDNGAIGDGDRVMIGNPWPKYIFGFSMGFDYRGFNFNVTANGVAGNDIIQCYRNHSRARPNYAVSILDRWHGEGTSNTVPRVTESNYNYGISDYLFQKGDYLRISNLTLGYDLSRVFKQQFLSRLRIYGSINNAFTFTNYDGADPEIGFGLHQASAGTDLGYYPRPRTFLIGFNVEL